MSEFTGYKLSCEQVENLVEHCQIEKFKKNDAVNMKPPKGMVPDEVRDNFNFIRKGKVGDWKEHFHAQSDQWQEWIKLNNTDNIPIQYE